MNLFHEEIIDTIIGERQSRQNSGPGIISNLAIGIKTFWTEDSKNNSLFKGYKEQLAVPEKSEDIDYKNSVIPSKFSPKEEMFLLVEIKNLHRKGVIKESQHEEGEYISLIFLTPKSDGSFRMILN